MNGDLSRKTDGLYDRESSGTYSCLSEQDKRQYCERLIDKVLRRYPHLHEDEVMFRLGHVCMEPTQSPNPPIRRANHFSTSKNQQNLNENDLECRKKLYAETLCRQVLLENPNFIPSKVKEVVMNIMNLVPEVGDESEDDSESSTEITSSSSVEVELSQSDCKAHNTAFDFIMEDVLGTRDACSDLATNENQRCDTATNVRWDEREYSNTLYNQQTRREMKETTDSEAQRLNRHLTEICKKLKMENDTSRSKFEYSRMKFADRNPCRINVGPSPQTNEKWNTNDSGTHDYSFNHYDSSVFDGEALRKSGTRQKGAENVPRMTFASANPCSVDCDGLMRENPRSNVTKSRYNWERSNLSELPPDQYNGKTTFVDRSMMDFSERNPCNATCRDWVPRDAIQPRHPTSRVHGENGEILYDEDSGYAPSPCNTKGIGQPASWGNNTYDIPCGDWRTPKSVPPRDFRDTVQPRMERMQTPGHYDPAYMSPNFQIPSIVPYNKWKYTSPCCADDAPFQYKSGTNSDFARRNPCSIWRSYCNGSDSPFGPSNVQHKNWYRMSPNYRYPYRRYAMPHSKYSALNRYC